MTFSNTVYIFGAAVLILLIIAFFIQIHRIWRVRFLLKNFKHELQKLNLNLENIITYIHGKNIPSNIKKSSRSICRNCVFRQTFIETGDLQVFLYQCKLDQRKISLNDTCKRYQKDLQNTQINGDN